MAEKRYLVVNTGSVSAKYSIYSELKELLFAHFEIEKGKYLVSFLNDRKNYGKKPEEISEEIFNDSLEYFLEKAIERKVIDSKDDISSIGLRIVAPGVYFQEDKIIDSFFLDNIINAEKEAPLHITATLKEITKIRKIFKSTPIVGISDSAFSKNVPDFAKYYAIPKDISDKYELYHYGYHG